MSFVVRGKGGHIELRNIDQWEELVRLAYLYDWKPLGPLDDVDEGEDDGSVAAGDDKQIPKLTGQGFTFQLPEQLRPKPLSGDDVLNPYLCVMIKVSDEDAQNFADALERSLRAMKMKGPEYVEYVEEMIEFFRAGAFETL